MKAHVCTPPAPDPRPEATTTAGTAVRWYCPEVGCQWVWRLNPVVLRWFRELPDAPP